MSWASLLLSFSLAGQVSTDGGRPSLEAPKFSPRRSAPAAPLEEPASPPKSSSSIYRNNPSSDRYSKGTSDGRPTMDAPASSGNATGNAVSPPASSNSSPYLNRSPAAPPSSRVIPSNPSNESLVRVEGARQRLRPPELLAEALADAKEGDLNGQAITLSAALNRVPDRQQQLVVTKAYWKLTAARADYHFARDGYDRLFRLTETQSDQATVQGAQAASRAAVRDAELNLTRAQFELAEQVSLLSTDSLPLPVDRPHVGEYRTHFEQIFQGRTPAAKARLVHNTLPIRRQAIDAHAAAILAALDAYDAIGEDYSRGAIDLAALLSAADQLSHQRRAFVAAVRDYNFDIADYAFSVAGENANIEKLVSMLIKTDSASASGSSVYGRGASPPLVETTVEPSTGGSGRTFRSAPAGSGSTGESRPSLSSPPADDAGQPNNGLPSSNPGGGDPFVPRRSMRKPVLDTAPGQSVDAGLYQGLLEVAAPARTQKLAGLLHWDRSLPKNHGQNISLADCLKRQSPTGRSRLIAAYWKSRERAARYQSLADEAESLATLRAVALELRDAQGGTRAMLQLEAARLSVKAAMLDEHVALHAAEFELTRTAGAAVDGVWLLASTPPHAGRYELKYDALPKEVARRWQVQRLASTIPLLHDELQDHAHAIVLADASRAAATADRQPSPETVVRALHAARRQSSESLAFLRTLTTYNLAIADYVIVLLPATTSGDKLASTLVLNPTGKAES